jgi:hypothetical protein
MVNTSQQVGGSIGTALLNTLAASATSSWITSHAKGANVKSKRFIGEAAVHGYSVAIWWATGILLLSSALAFFLVHAEVQNHTERPTGDDSASDVAVPVIAH